MEKAILTSPKIIKILRDKGYSAKIRKDDKTITIIVIDKSTGGSYFFSGGKKQKELIKFVLESG